MVKKLFGYILALVGIAGVGVTSFPSGKTFIEDLLKYEAGKLPASVPNTILIVSLILVGIGLILVFQGGSKKKQPLEVPIYEGEGKKRTIVGIQRLGK